MKLGASVPQNELGTDPDAIRRYAQGVEELGYDFVTIPEHVLGADPERSDWDDFEMDTLGQFHEPLTLYSYFAAVTDSLTLLTGIVILPQRQTALVAKQAAELDVLSGGRLKLGIGIGVAPPEFVALGENFHDRGVRSEEQMEVLRALWTNELVEFEGRWHDIPSVGINPRPVQQPIPIWMGGGYADVVLRRIGRMGDGWLAPYAPSKPEIAEKLAVIEAAADEAGRDLADFSVVGHLMLASMDDVVEETREWADLGATHLPVVTDKFGYETVEEHLEKLGQVRDDLDRAGLLQE